MEFVLSIPEPMLFLPDATKRIARAAMTNLLPQSVYERRHQTTFGQLFEKGLELHGQRLLQAVIASDDPSPWRRFVREDQLPVISKESSPAATLSRSVLLVPYLVSFDRWYSSID